MSTSKRGLLKFFVPLDAVSNNHKVSVVLHRKRRHLRNLRRYKGQNDVSDAYAFCWQGNRPTKDHVVAEVHLAIDFLTVEYISHESAHAAVHRANLLGLKLGTNEWEEQVATDTGIITQGIVTGISGLNINIVSR